MITITVDTDDEERALRAAFQDGRLSRAIWPRFAIKRDGKDVGGMDASLIEGGARETYLSAGPPSGTITITVNDYPQGSGGTTARYGLAHDV